MHACRNLLAWLAASAVSFGASHASPYNPHVPGHAPWFEGWYTRVVDRDSDLSFGAVTGYFPNQTLTEPSAFAGILYAASRANLTQAYQHLPPSIMLTSSDGTPVHKQPSKLGEAHFALHTADKSCNLTARSTAFEMSVVAGNATLTVKGDSAGMPWGPGGETPEGAAAYLPFLHLHWYVYSLATPVTWAFHDPKMTSEPLTGHGFAHMEKNWGRTFPDKWVWAQGMRLNRQGSRQCTETPADDPEVVFALAGGQLPFLGAWANWAGSALPTFWLLAYHSKPSNLKWNFRPYDPTVFKTHIDACRGTFQLTATRLRQSIQVTIRASTDSFAALLCPTSTGFREQSSHSFAGDAHLEAYSYRVWPPTQIGWQLIEVQDVRNVALEFGGHYRC